MAGIDEILVPSLLFDEVSEPDTPDSGTARLFLDTSDGILKWKDDAGTVREIGTALVNPMTTEGDVIVGGTDGVPERLGPGSKDDVFTIVSGVPAWAAPAGAALGAWTTYVPAWTSSGTAPAIVNGTLEGAYKLVDAETMDIVVKFVYGSSSTPGTGTYFFSIPSGYKAKSGNNLHHIGAAWLLDAGTNNFAGTSSLGAGGTTMVTYIADATTGFRLFGAGVPITLATGDTLGISLRAWVETV